MGRRSTLSSCFEEHWLLPMERMQEGLWKFSAGFMNLNMNKLWGWIILCFFLDLSCALFITTSGLCQLDSLSVRPPQPGDSHMCFRILRSADLQLICIRVAEKVINLLQAQFPWLWFLKLTLNVLEQSAQRQLNCTSKNSVLFAWHFYDETGDMHHE